MTVVLVAPAQSADGDQGRDTRTQLQRWVDVLERRGHDVYLVGPSDLPIRVQHHVAARLDVADTVQALADAMQGVPPPIVLLDGGVRGSAVTVEEVESANGTVVLAEPHERDDGAARMPPDAPLRVAGDVVVAAGSSLHQLREWTHDGVGLLRVDAADTAAVASALRVMGDVAGAQKWKSQVLPLTTVAAVRAGVRVHAMGAGTLPWRVSELDGSDDPDDAEERRLRIAAAVGPAQGVVDRLVGIPLAERLAQLFWRLGVSGRTLAVLGVVSALFAGVLVSTGTAIAMVTGAAMLLASVIFDRIDGVLTRARRTASPFGAWLGATTDWFREAAVVIGLAVGAAAVAAPKWALACGV
ncbi:MAG TPA: CDP-alcohol phosphatidyltransferase family protein, partial [Actinomycetes bacterium]|nr:CDP-alcohol phosphatidyltransferase family protein [Actinomycetes bacterium]